MPTLRLAVIHEPEATCLARLAAAGFPAGAAEEIAVYLAQSTDLGAVAAAVTEEAAAEGVMLEIVALDDALARLPAWRADPVPTVLWPMTDGIAYFRGAHVGGLARLAGLPAVGSEPLAQHLCQDKFACGMLARAAGIATPETALYAGDRFVAGDRLDGAGPWFVKPNRLGAKTGVFADSRAPDLAAALALCRRIEARYCDRAVVQRYVAGDDVRVSVLELDGPIASHAGVFRLAKDPAGEAGGAFMTMRDNLSLSGASDTQGGVGGFGAKAGLAFTPRLTDLRALAREGDAAASHSIATIVEAAERARSLFGLADLFSFDFRVRPDGTPVFLEFEVCPAVTIYDFRTHLQAMHGLTLGAALARLARKALARGVAL